MLTDELLLSQGSAASAQKPDSMGGHAGERPPARALRDGAGVLSSAGLDMVATVLQQLLTLV